MIAPICCFTKSSVNNWVHISEMPPNQPDYPWILSLFLSSDVFTALEFESNHFGTLLWKIVKPRDNNEIEPRIEKIFLK